MALASRGILHARSGRIEKAVHDAHHAAQRQPDGLVKLQLAGIFALSSSHSHDAEYRKQAFYWLAATLKHNPSLARVAATDPDLSPLRPDVQFSRLIGAALSLEDPQRGL
ncbi:MAG: hypothetical protein R3C05_16095 [Pirellulaceae bacterium]